MRIRTKAMSKIGTPNCTDLGNARRLKRQHGDDLRYCFEFKTWYVWDETHWLPDPGYHIGRRVRDTIRKMYAELPEIKDPKKRAKLAEWAIQSENRGRMNAMVAVARELMPIDENKLDANPWLLGVLNGTLDLRTGEIREPQRGDYITKQAPVEYDEHADCPYWKKFLNRVLDGNERLIEFLKRSIGYSMTGDTREQCFFVLYGTGANGKSTFLSTIKSLLGDHAIQTDMNSFMVRERSGSAPSPDLARLHGARFVLAMEAEDQQRLAENLIKQLTGGDALAARQLYQQQIEFQPMFKLWMGTNHLPNIRDTTHATWRRIKLIPFKVQIPKAEQDTRLLERLRGELPGILNWALEGCHAWQRDRLKEPKEVREAVSAYKSDQDVVKEFLDDCCEVGAAREETLKSVYERYLIWAKDSNVRAETKKRFTILMQEHGFDTRTATGNVRMLSGVETRESPPLKKFRLVTGGKKG